MPELMGAQYLTFPERPENFPLKVFALLELIEPRLSFLGHHSYLLMVLILYPHVTQR